MGKLQDHLRHLLERWRQSQLKEGVSGRTEDGGSIIVGRRVLDQGNDEESVAQQTAEVLSYIQRF